MEPNYTTESPIRSSLDSTAQTGHANGADWQEETYQKIKSMKDLYLPKINEMHQKIVAKLQQHDSLPQQSKSDQLEKLKVFKTMLERIITFLQVSKSNIPPGFKDKLGSYEVQIVNFINTNWPKKPALQQGQFPAPHMQPMQLSQSQLAQMQSQTGHANGADWQEEIYQRIKSMKDLYFPEINEMHQKIVAKLQQHDSLPQQSKSDQLEKLKVFKTMLERIITFLQVSKSNIPPGYKDNLGSYEEQIANFINTNQPKKPALQQGQFPAPHMQSMQQPQSQLAQMQSQTGHANGADWQEEIYQRIKSMKDLYFPEINEMHQKIVAKLQQHDSLPQQSKSDQLEKMKVFKTMLERIITFLQVSKSNIPPGFKDKLGSYEVQIVNFINTNRPKKPALQQGQLPAPHMQSVLSHENQINLQFQSMNLQDNSMSD